MPAGAMPPLPRLLPLHFSLSPPPSFPPSPLLCDSLWAVQKPHALIYLFFRLAGRRCAARRSRLGGARTQGFKYQPRALREDLLGGPQTHLATLSPPHTPRPIKKSQGASRRGGNGEREGRSQASCPKESGRGALHRRPQPRRGGGGCALCAPWGAGGSGPGGGGKLRGGGSGHAGLPAYRCSPFGDRGSPLPLRREVAKAEEIEKSQAVTLLARLRRGSVR